MAIPAYLWLKDDGGADIKGSVDVQGREGSIEIVALEHALHIPTGNSTGKLIGTRVHDLLVFTKEVNASTPYLYKAVMKSDWHGLVTALVLMFPLFLQLTRRFCHESTIMQNV
ncbi:type VI secretion system effector, Hcp1 family [Photorhabdus temperata subsp. temperata Meg1]|uniref:Type VI secretion system effector, Hcp1 family n=1 Tax=Photorhabdus temperata subsp. temperata Meg1 TaxID=1393735 RepID=A0A081RXV3_PHOTE|nr:type VI secretion system effector, Hcp1 family [Photorhabdus temperata subsp. temperata Meg1]